MSNQKPKVEAFFNEGESLKDSSPESEKNKKIEKKEETIENLDNLAFDKKLWNLGDIQQYPDLTLKKESESKYSIDNPDILNQRLKEYLNEDLLNAIDSSPMIAPKNIIKDAVDENNPNNKDIDNDENIIEISDEDNKDLFQFSLYNNQDEKETNNEKNDSINESNELNNINLDVINKIKEDEGGGNLNDIKEIKIKEENQIIENQIIENQIIENQINIEKEDEKEEEKNKQKEEKKKENKIEEKSENNKEKQKELNKKNYIQPQPQYQYPIIQFPYAAKPIIGTTNLFGHENKFDGNKKYQVIVPFVLKKNVKTKKPFEIREGDWTCSNCNNLNFSFRVKCNRCDISKEESEKNKSKENKEQKFPQTKNKNYYPNVNMNMIQYKYFPGYIYVPIQGQFNKKEKK